MSTIIQLRPSSTNTSPDYRRPHPLHIRLYFNGVHNIYILAWNLYVKILYTRV